MHFRSRSVELTLAQPRKTAQQIILICAKKYLCITNSIRGHIKTYINTDALNLTKYPMQSGQRLKQSCHLAPRVIQDSIKAMSSYHHKILYGTKERARNTSAHGWLTFYYKWNSSYQSNSSNNTASATQSSCATVYSLFGLTVPRYFLF